MKHSACKHTDKSGKSVSKGENLYYANGYAASDTLAVDAVQSWYDEINDYSYDTCDSINGKQIGHFTQVTKNFIML